MGTRARIGIQLKDNSVLSVYHHWDGYPEWLGRILKTHYNSKEKASELIDGGDMSVCWTKERWTGKELASNNRGATTTMVRGTLTSKRFTASMIATKVLPPPVGTMTCPIAF